MEDHLMRKTLLLTTALLAGVTLGSAQSPNNRQSEGATQSKQAQEHQTPRDRTTRQSTQRDREGQNQRQGNAQNEREERGNQRQGEAQQGQNQRQGNAQNQRDERRNQRQGEAQQGQRQQQGNAQNQREERGNQRQGEAQQGQGQQGTVNLTAEQRTKIRQDIFSGSNVPRVDNANFSVRVGTVVPNDVRIVEVPETLITIHPEWRGDQYFVMRDDVIIVDHDHRIVAVMAVGSSAAQRGGGLQGGSVSLSQSEIREAQMKLNQKGFNVGEPDGVMGPKTRDGLAQFQRQEGLQETGDIDRQTADALGISNAPSTTGSAPRNR